MSLAIVHKSNLMTAREYEQARAALPRDRKQSGAHFDQALASLFYQSGWTQERLAKKEGLSQQRICERLRLGRFLNFTAMAVKSESAVERLTERKFRELWALTTGEEKERFVQVMDFIERGALDPQPREAKVKEKTVSAEVLTTKLGPIIDGLREEGKKNAATMSPATVAYLAHQLRKLLDEWTK